MIKMMSIAAIILITACNQPSKATTETSSSTSQTDTNTSLPPSPETSPVTENEAKVLTGCYMQVLKRDTFATTLVQQGNKVTGKLSFNNYEKDASSGTVTGNIENGIVKLLYTFNAEGMTSKMEVYFKHEPGKLTRGTGPMEPKGDLMVFKDPATVAYNNNTMMQIPCEQLPGKYK
ncbi:MAG: hypothetical protein ABIT96_01070 [Ferruginibacter sp.]